MRVSVVLAIVFLPCLGLVACAAARALPPPPSVVTVAPPSSAVASVDAGAGEDAGDAPGLDVVLVVNVEVARANRVGAQLGPIARSLPQWNDLVAGAGYDLGAHVKWVIVSGPSLVDSRRDVMLIRLDTASNETDAALERIARRGASGGPWDAGVPGMTGYVARWDRGDRVLLRSGPLVGVLPSTLASRGAYELARASGAVPPLPPDMAASLRMRDPSRAFPALPPAIGHLYARVVTRPDQGADLVVECGTADEAAAAAVAEDLRRLLARWNSMAVELVTGGLLDAPQVSTAGPTVIVRLSATEEVLEKLLALARAVVDTTAK